MSEQIRQGRAARSAACDPYELRGTRMTEVWRGDRLVASYTSVAAASHLCDQLNEAYFAGVAAGLRRAGDLAMSIALGGTKSREAVPARCAAPPLVRLGPGGDFTHDLTEEVRHAPRG